MLKRFHDSGYRRRMEGALTCILVFLLPLTGWIPILALWALELCLSLREVTGHGMRIFLRVLLGPALLWIIYRIIPCGRCHYLTISVKYCNFTGAGSYINS